VKRSRALSVIVVLLAIALLLAACGSSSKSSSNNTSGGSPTSSGTDFSKLASATLNGSGSTFQKTFDQVAIQGFKEKAPSVTVNYAGGGSGKGKTDLQTKTVDFAGTDSLVKPADVSKYQGGAFLYFPTVAAPITVSYKVSGVDKLQLSPDTLAKIFSRQIKKWDDAAIKADNSGVNLPSKDIVVAHRADASGTTSNFTKYLAAAAPTSWKLGSGDTVPWPSDTQAGTGNAGVAQIVSQTDGAIGYVDYSDAKAANLKFASIKNSAGKFIDPTTDSAAAAVATATVNPDLTYSPLNSSGADAYPITSPTWILVYKNQTDKAKGEALKGFLEYILTDGQGLANEANYAKLPESLRSKAVAQLSQIQIPA
jgi:phosphate transport system substrate-binding protein